MKQPIQVVNVAALSVCHFGLKLSASWLRFASVASMFTAQRRTSCNLYDDDHDDDSTTRRWRNAFGLYTSNFALPIGSRSIVVFFDADWNV